LGLVPHDAANAKTPVGFSLFTRIRFFAAAYTMNPSTTANARWSTASFGLESDTSSVDLESLRSHLASCQEPLRTSFILSHSAASVYGFLTARIISTLLLGSLFLAVILRIW
jgi:hypothetical protein